MSEQADESNESSALTHEDAVGLLDAWRDGELSEPEATRVEAHLETCARCKAVESALGGGIRSAVIKGAARGPDEGKSLLPGVQRRLRLRSRGRFYGEDESPPRRGPSPWPLVIGSVAVLAALLISYILIGQVASTGAPSPAPSSSGSASK
jgi:anti-sigma factor RsiW